MLTPTQKRNIELGLSKNGFVRVWGGWVRVIVYVCPKCHHPNLVRKSWHDEAPRGGFRCANCEYVIGF